MTGGARRMGPTWIREWLARHEMNQLEAAKLIGMTPQHFRKLLSERHDVQPHLGLLLLLLDDESTLVRARGLRDGEIPLSAAARLVSEMHDVRPTLPLLLTLLDDPATLERARRIKGRVGPAQRA